MLNLEKCEIVGEEKEAPAIREQIECVAKILHETEMTMEYIISSIIGKPLPERTIADANCLQSTFTEVNESAVLCMEMSKKIQSLILGGK